MQVINRILLIAIVSFSITFGLTVLFAKKAYGETQINWLGNSCQVCMETETVKVCKFYKKCPYEKDDPPPAPKPKTKK